MASVFLKPGREKSVRNGHPWVFSGAIARTSDNPGKGDLIDIFDHQGKWLAKGGYNPQSQIAARIWTWDPQVEIGLEFFKATLEKAFVFRKPILYTTNACRLINAENDLLPGLILDQYGEYFVIQFLTAAAEAFRPEILQAVMELPAWKGLYERSDVDVRKKEGLPLQKGLLQGTQPDLPIPIQENKWDFLVDIAEGHKTGFYLDQRTSRTQISEVVRQYLPGGDVLNVFSYTGAFAISCLTAGARKVVNIDSSGPALNLSRRNMQINQLSPTEDSFLEGNAFELLREFHRRGISFDMVILDPPKLAHAKSDAAKATRAYKDINLSAMRILRPNGILATFSCSGLISEDLFQKIIFGAAVDAKREVQIFQRCNQASDHPILLTFPEGAYLKGFLCRVL